MTCVRRLNVTASKDALGGSGAQAEQPQAIPTFLSVARMACLIRSDLMMPAFHRFSTSSSFVDPLHCQAILLPLSLRAVEAGTALARRADTRRCNLLGSEVSFRAEQASRREYATKETEQAAEAISVVGLRSV